MKPVENMQARPKGRASWAVAQGINIARGIRLCPTRMGKVREWPKGCWNMNGMGGNSRLVKKSWRRQRDCENYEEFERLSYLSISSSVFYTKDSRIWLFSSKEKKNTCWFLILYFIQRSEGWVFSNSIFHIEEARTKVFLIFFF